jgi:gluconolactonase
MADAFVTTDPELLASGFTVTEGPTWHPAGFWYFVDRRSRLYRLVPGEAVDVVRTTEGGNGTTFDLDGNLIVCEGRGRKVTRMTADGSVTTIADRFDGGRLNKPNDVVCRSDGSLFFTDPDKRVAYRDREIPGPDGDDGVFDGAGVYRIAPDGTIHRVALCEYPNGLAFSPDEQTLYVANTRSSRYLHALTIDAAGAMVARSIFADMNAGTEPGIPDGVKVDVEGRVYCTGSGGIWVFDPAGQKIGVIRFPERAVNFAFGGPDLKTLFCCTESSVYSVRVRVAGNPHPWYQRAGLAAG